MDEDPFAFLFYQRIKLLENQRKSWNTIDTKNSLMLTQAFLSIGLAMNSLKGCNLLFVFPIVIAIILYLIGIWPQNQTTIITPELFMNISGHLSNNPSIEMKDFYRSFSCIDNKDILKELDRNMNANTRIINTKCILFELGVIMNIIGVIYIIMVIALNI